MSARALARFAHRSWKLHSRRWGAFHAGSKESLLNYCSMFFTCESHVLSFVDDDHQVSSYPECPWLHQIFTPMVIVIKLRLVILDNIFPWFATRRMPNIVPLCWNHKKSQCASRCKSEFPNIPIDMQNQRIWNTYRYAFQIRWCVLLFLESWKNRSGSRCANDFYGSTISVCQQLTNSPRVSPISHCQLASNQGLQDTTHDWSSLLR